MQLSKIIKFKKYNMKILRVTSFNLFLSCIAGNEKLILNSVCGIFA